MKGGGSRIGRFVSQDFILSSTSILAASTAVHKRPAPRCMSRLQILGHFTLRRLWPRRPSTPNILHLDLPIHHLLTGRRRLCSSSRTSTLGQEEEPRVSLAHGPKRRVMAVHDIERDRDKDPNQEAVRQELIDRPLFKEEFRGDGAPEERSRKEQVQVPKRPSTISP